MEGRTGNDDLTDDVTVSQGQMLQNDDSQQNINLRQNPNPNRNQNQGQQQALYLPFENMHLNPNRNNLNEPQRPPPRYQLNAERVISSNYLPSYQNQYIRRPPSTQPSTNVNVASNSGGVTGQGRPGVVADSSNTAQHTTGFPKPSLNSGHPASNHAVPSNTLSRPPARPNLDSGDPMASHAEYSYIYSTQPVVFNPNYFSIPPERPNINPGLPMANPALASNNTPSFPLAGRGFVPRVGSYMSPMQIPVIPTAQASVPAAGFTSQSFSVNQAIPAVLPSFHHRRSCTQGANRRNCGCPECTRAITSLGASQIRSQGVSLHQAVPATSSVPPSSESQEEFVIIPYHSASQSVRPGVSVHQGVPDTPSVPASRAITSLGTSQIRNQVVPGTSSVPPSSDLQEEFVVVPHHSASPTRSPGVSVHQGVPDTPSVPASRTVTSLGASQIRNQFIPGTWSVPPSSDLQEEFVVVPHHSASPTRSPDVSVHQWVPDTPSVPASRAITSLGASQIRNQGVSMHQAVPATLSVLPSSDSQKASQIRSQGVSLVTPSVSASSLSVPSHTPSTSQIRNRGAPAVPVRPGYSLHRGTSQQLQLPVHESNMSRNEQVRAHMRARHPKADERQLDILVEREVEAIMIRRRQVDSHMHLDTDHTSREKLVELEEGMGYVNTGVGEEIVNERTIQRTFSALSEKGSETCCICLKEYVEGDEIGRLDCGHKFHSECIKKWLPQKNTCPICEKAWHWYQRE